MRLGKREFVDVVVTLFSDTGFYILARALKLLLEAWLFYHFCGTGHSLNSVSSSVK